MGATVEIPLKVLESVWDVDGQVLWARQAGGENSMIACHGSPNPSVYVTGQFQDPSAWNTT